MSEVVFYVETHNTEETEALGRILGSILRPGDVMALMGELGAGKTVLSKGIASGLGVENTDSVTSPTYKILNQYEGRLLMNHFDAYRLEGADDFADAGGEDLILKGAVSVIEWAERLGNVLPRHTIMVRIHVLSSSKRKLEFTFDDSRTELIKALGVVSGGNA